MFWDVVVLTALDRDQKLYYELEINRRLEANAIPRAEYRVYSDWPQGCRIGGGGATLLALSNLHREFEDQLFQKRILLLHCGGYSQRQPNCSVCGKIFSILPRANKHGRPYCLLELKLELYTPFLKRMRPGVFLAASDTLEAFSLEGGWSFDTAGFTVLAHPSSIGTGKHHGVYILENNSDAGDKLSCMSDCFRVLQKPSEAVMRSSGAVYKRQMTPNESGESDTVPSEFVHTDSAFFFSSEVAQALIAFYDAEQPITVELDCYGDFLQPLGRDASTDYVTDNSRVTVPDPEDSKKLVDLRGRLFQRLHEFSIKALVLRDSRFYHLGTFSELLNHFCCDDAFKIHFDLQSVVCSRSADAIDGPLYERFHNGCCIVHSIISPGSSVAPMTLVEYCEFIAPIHVIDGCILSNCRYDEEFSLNSPAFFLTVPVSLQNVIGYVTVVFGTANDMKLRAKEECLPYFDSTVSVAKQKLGIASSADLTSLWKAKLFPVAPSMKKSFKRALNLCKIVVDNERIPIEVGGSNMPELFSIQDVVQLKHMASVLKVQEDLFAKITTYT